MLNCFQVQPIHNCIRGFFTSSNLAALGVGKRSAFLKITARQCALILMSGIISSHFSANSKLKIHGLKIDNYFAFFRSTIKKKKGIFSRIIEADSWTC